jgi:putative flippase GtrA
MYTHARQFPHLARKSDSEIRELVRREMIRRPTLIRAMQIRNVALLVLVILTVAGLVRYAGLTLGPAMIATGASATVLVLLWNFVWVNCVIFKITQPDPIA